MGLVGVVGMIGYEVVCFLLEGKILYYRRTNQMNKPFYGAASMPKSERSKIVNKHDVPGPGSYDSNKEKTHNDLPKWSLKKRLEQGSCFEKLSSTPGPGMYNEDEGFKKQEEMIISTKGDKYHNYFDKSYPHSQLHLPGAINLKSGHSFGYREAAKQTPKSPGPVYHLDQIAENIRLQKDSTNLNGFGCQKKHAVQNDSTPGPGAFSPANKNAWAHKTCESWSFGAAKRSDSLPGNDVGPGEYDPKHNSNMGRSFKLRERNEPKLFETSSLGPGAYNLPDTKTKKGTKFNALRQTGSEDEEDGNKSEDDLSPCMYSPPRYLDRPINNGFSMGKRLGQTLNSDSQEPGPGGYQISGKYAKGAGGYMGRKAEQKKKQNASTDNFYRYDPNQNSVARESPKFSFPQGRKDQKENRAATNYSQQFYQAISVKTGHSYSMGTSKRFPDLKKESNLFKQKMTDFSTMGQMPGYLKKGIKKK